MAFISTLQSCSRVPNTGTGTRTGTRYGYNEMGMGTSTGTKPCWNTGTGMVATMGTRVRVQVQWNGYEYG